MEKLIRKDWIYKNWWKVLGVILIYYTVVAGYLIKVPRIDIINESVRNQFFHVSMWFSMMILLTTSLIYAIKYLLNPDNKAFFGDSD